MSRSGYNEDDGEGTYNLWRGTVARTIRGKRGQAFLRELLEQLDAMPVKRLIAEELAIAEERDEDGEVVEEGGVCAIGTVGKARGIDMTKLDPEDPHGIAKAFNVAPALVQEIEWWNDEAGRDVREEVPPPADSIEGTKYEKRYRYRRETQEERWTRMRKWVAEQINQSNPGRRPEKAE